MGEAPTASVTTLLHLLSAHCTDILPGKYRRLCLGLQLPNSSSQETFPISFIDGNFEPHTYLFPEYCGLPYTSLNPASLSLPPSPPIILSLAHGLLQGSLGRGLQVSTSLPLCVMEEMGNCPETPEDGHLATRHSLQCCHAVGASVGKLLLSHSRLAPPPATE